MYILEKNDVNLNRNIKIKTSINLIFINKISYTCIFFPTIHVSYIICVCMYVCMQ